MESICPTRAQHTSLWIGGMVLWAGPLPRCIQFRDSHLHPHPWGRGGPKWVSWVILEIRLADGAVD